MLSQMRVNITKAFASIYNRISLLRQSPSPLNRSSGDNRLTRKCPL